MPEPVFVALLLADRVITEDNQKKGIIGTFTQFSLRQLPAILPPWFIYAAVTNLLGDHSFSVNLVFDRSQQVIFSAGVSTVCFFIDGNQIGSRVLEVSKVEDTPGPARGQRPAQAPAE